ncbi:MAG: SpoVR family protein [Minisyncoccia bacterium]
MADTMEVMEDVAVNDLGLSLFPNQVIVVSHLGMLDAYAHGGMPALYPHWSFGKKWKELEFRLKNGDLHLAYEMIVPTNPCISWNMASNNMATMAGVLAHAAFGHNHVFRNNHVFKKWTHSSVLADYCTLARDTILAFEAQYGEDEVEEVLDAAHALQIPGGFFRFEEPPAFDLKEERKRLADKMRALEASIDPELIDVIPGLRDKLTQAPELPKDSPVYPQENILYFIERYSPRLQAWEREVIRIVRTIAQQTMYPYLLTKTLNEGAAEFIGGYLMGKLYEKGYIDGGTVIDQARVEAGVNYQADMRETGKLEAHLNPYALGLSIFKEIVRISGIEEHEKLFFKGWIDTDGPTEEDRKWFSWAGDRQWRTRLRHAWADYTDQTLIEQYLSPRLMRELKLFVVRDEGRHYVVTDTLHERTPSRTGYEAIRAKLADSYALDARIPRVEVVGADLLDERTLKLRYVPREGMTLKEESAVSVLEHAERLWGYKVSLDA